MIAPGRVWNVRLATAALADINQIVSWSASRLGKRQARTYGRTLAMAIEALTSGPETVGVKRRDDLLPGILMLHVARKRRHFVVFRVRQQRVIEVLRVLHDAMDLPEHLRSTS